MKTNLYIITILLISQLFVYSQSHPTWQKVYRNPHPYPNFSASDVYPAGSGNFFVVCQPWYLFKINPYGDTIWKKDLGTLLPYTAVSSGDGGCVLTGGNGGLYTAKINSSGNIVWQREYYNGDWGIFSTIIRTQNNTYVACGYGNYVNASIMNVDSSGNLIWEKQFSAPFRMNFNSVCEAHNGGYIASGYLMVSEFSFYGVVTRVDNSGNLIWEKRYQYNGDGIEFYTILQLNEGYLLLGSALADTSITGVRVALIKTDTSGNITFMRMIPEGRNKYTPCFDLKIVNSNKYLISSAVANLAQDTIQALEILTDSFGNIIKSYQFTEKDWSYFERSYIVDENDFILVGRSDHLNPNFVNAYLVRTDSNFYYPPIGIRIYNKSIPIKFELHQNYPNPFNPSTKIKFEIPKSSYTKLIIYDILGREVITLVNEQLKPGSYEVEWNASNYGSGVYFYKLTAGDYSSTMKMVLLK